MCIKKEKKTCFFVISGLQTGDASKSKRLQEIPVRIK